MGCGTPAAHTAPSAGAGNACAVPTHSRSPPGAPSSFVPLPDAQNASFCRNWSLSTGPWRRQQPLASAQCQLLPAQRWGPAVVVPSSASWSSGSFGAGGTGGQSHLRCWGPALSLATPGRLASRAGTLEALGRLDCVRPPLWEGFGVLLGPGLCPSPVLCVRVPSPRGTGKSGVSFERAPAATGAGKGEAGWLPL